MKMLPTRVNKPLVRTLLNVFGEFGEHRAVNTGQKALIPAKSSIRGLLFSCWSLLAGFGKPQCPEKYLRTTSQHGVHFVSITTKLFIGARSEVRFTRLKTQILFCGILDLPNVFTVTVRSYDTLNTPEGSLFYELSTDFDIMALSAVLLQVVSAGMSKKMVSLKLRAKCSQTSCHGDGLQPMSTKILRAQLQSKPVI